MTKRRIFGWAKKKKMQCWTKEKGGLEKKNRQGGGGRSTRSDSPVFPNGEKKKKKEHGYRLKRDSSNITVY